MSLFIIANLLWCYALSFTLAVLVVDHVPA